MRGDKKYCRRPKQVAASARLSSGLSCGQGAPMVLLPLYDVDPLEGKTTPFVTYGLIAINVIVGIAVFSLSRTPTRPCLTLSAWSLRLRRANSRAWVCFRAIWLCSARCSYTSAGCISSATCGSFGYSATTSRMRSVTCGSWYSIFCAALAHRPCLFSAHPISPRLW